MKKKLLILPLIAFLLGSCGNVNKGDNNTNPNNDDSQENENNENSNPNEGDTDQKPDDGESSNPDIKPDEGEGSTPDNKPDEGEGSTPDTKPDEGEGSTPDTNPDEGGETKPTPNPDNRPIPDPNGEKLPNGFRKIKAPDNLYNPLDVSSDYYNFDCTTEVPENWKYIYMNNATNGTFYQDNNMPHALKFADANRGLQTPALKSASKYEVRLRVSELHGGNDKRKDKSKETFLIYGFDENTKLVHEAYYTPFKKGIDKDRKDKFDIKFYIENPAVRYIEIRLNDRLFSDEKTQQYVNFGVDQLTLKSYNF